MATSKQIPIRGIDPKLHDEMLKKAIDLKVHVGEVYNQAIVKFLKDGSEVLNITGTGL